MSDLKVYLKNQAKLVDQALKTALKTATAAVGQFLVLGALGVQSSTAHPEIDF